MIVINLEAIGLAYSFMSALSREIGLKFCGVVGSLLGLGRATTRAFSIS